MARGAKSLIGCLAVSLFCGAPTYAAEAGECAKKVAMAPVRLAAFGSGVVVGTPIAVARKSWTNYVDATNAAAGGSDKMLPLAAGALVGMPVGIFTGTVEGLWLGWANSWKNSSEKPFGKDSFSLGELE